MDGARRKKGTKVLAMVDERLEFTHLWIIAGP